jgi:phage FluMu protein Com
MPGSSFTFRCPECGKLLGVSRGRVGSDVQCPRCRSEITVPDPEGPSRGRAQAGSVPEMPIVAAPDEGAAGILPGLVLEPEPLSIRPETRRPARRSGASGESTALATPPSAETAAFLGNPPHSDASPDPETQPGAELVAAPAPRRQDVVLPRIVVTFWSLAMLLAILFAFATGLLAGHFLWSNHPAAPTATSRVEGRFRTPPTPLLDTPPRTVTLG